MSQIKKTILKMILIKKKYIQLKNMEINENILNFFQQSNNSKRYEQNLRFIANKTFRFLQTAFKAQKFQSLIDKLNKNIQSKCQNAKLAYSFFSYYFEKYAMKSDIAIESFFHPNTQRIKDLNLKNLVPKTISQQYMKSLRISPEFINDCLFFLNKIIILDAQHDIVNKTRKLCQDWESILRGKDEHHLLQVVKKKIWTNPKFKLPWTIYEVKIGIDQMIKILDSDQSEL